MKQLLDTGRGGSLRLKGPSFNPVFIFPQHLYLMKARGLYENRPEACSRKFKGVCLQKSPPTMTTLSGSSWQFVALGEFPAGPGALVLWAKDSA